MTAKYPLEYDLTPQTVEAGRGWLKVTLENVGSDPLAALDVRLNSLDVYGVSVSEGGQYLPVLEPNQREALPFQVLANASARVYITVDGRRDGEPFHWESPGILLTVGEEAARLESLRVLNQPYLKLREKVKCEAIIRGRRKCRGLKLQLWVDEPDDTFVELADIETKPLSQEESVKYVAEFTPDEEGQYTIYAYLYDGVHRIGREVDSVYASSVRAECE